MGIFPFKYNKRMSLSEAAELVNDGDIVAIGGNLSAREPMGMIRELIRQGKRDLHTVGGAHGVDIDLMCVGGIVVTVQNSFVGLEADFGLAPHFRRMAQEGKIRVRETDCIAVMMQLRASQFGLPFMPTPVVDGTQVLELSTNVHRMTCPFTGETVNLLPALRPNVAIIHAHRADEQGNVKLYPPYFADLLFVESSDKVIVTVEKIIAQEEMKHIGSNIPYYEITAIVELPLGAHPTSCYPDYSSYDRSHLAEYMRATQEGPETFISQYLQRYVLGPADNHEYLELIGGKRKWASLRNWNKDEETWQ
ncbi:MAG: CoA transferase subunit A [Deltaproteobacteria bacterium]|nr:CoA transferase subunit A [Deltaproteobacteria bacterium]